MKKNLLLLFIISASFLLSFKSSAQNADEIIFNAYQSPYNYVAGSFVIDTGVSTANQQNRAFLIWANNLQQDSVKRNLSLSEYDPSLNFLTEQGAAAEKFGSIKNMFPKKIIKSKFTRDYYLLGYTTNSAHSTAGLKVFSSPVIYKISGATLGVIWASKINLSVLTPNNVNTVIEYNDIIETSDKNVVVVGKYAGNTQAKEFVLATKLKGSNGALIWRYKYTTDNKCNEAANSVAETKDGRLSLTGYVKKCTTTFNGNSNVFYLELSSTGIPVPATYFQYIWPSGLNMWADKITCYTSSAGSDQLIISGYVDIQAVTGAIDRQILILNVKQAGNLVTAQHIGGSKSDVCNDLIFKKNGSTGTDYLIYFTGQTASYNSQPSVFAEAYFAQTKFNINSGANAIGEFSTFPVTAVPYNTYTSRNGIEIKNAGDYKKFAILATGAYKPTTTTSGTYSNVLIRDFNDASSNCIKQQQPSLTQFSFDFKQSQVSFDTPALKVYKEDWTRLGLLNVKEPCQTIKIDPSHALNIKEGNDNPVSSEQKLRINPNPASSVIHIHTTDGLPLAGKYKTATLRIYNSAMQMEKMLPVNTAQGNALNLPIAQLKPGVYMVQLVRGDESLSCTFIKE